MCFASALRRKHAVGSKTALCGVSPSSSVTTWSTMKLLDYPETDSLYIERKPTPGRSETCEIAEGLAVDIDAEGGVVGLDIGYASQKLDLSRWRPSLCRRQPPRNERRRKRLARFLACGPPPYALHHPAHAVKRPA